LHEKEEHPEILGVSLFWICLCCCCGHLDKKKKAEDAEKAKEEEIRK